MVAEDRELGRAQEPCASPQAQPRAPCPPARAVGTLEASTRTSLYLRELRPGGRGLAGV